MAIGTYTPPPLANITKNFFELSSNGVELCLTFNTFKKKEVLLTKYVIYRYPRLHTYM